MIGSSRGLRVGKWHVIDVQLEETVSQFDHGQQATAIFGLAACEPFRMTLLTSACRGTAADRLARVLATGVDVEPSNAPIWVSSLDKAMEYGELPKLLLVFDPEHLDRSFREIDTSDSRRAHLQQTFPTQLVSQDGSKVWLSRLSADDRRIGPGYEEAYGHWIPGDAREALIAIVIIQHPSHGPPIDVDQHVRDALVPPTA